jgi:hypothetical protein
VKHQLLVCAADDNLLRENIHITQTNIESLLDASKEAGIEVNVEKTTYVSPDDRLKLLNKSRIKLTNSMEQSPS